eukprot:9482734-Pyramimonas_sp.AAC.2
MIDSTLFRWPGTHFRVLTFKRPSVSDHPALQSHGAICVLVFRSHIGPNEGWFDLAVIPRNT